ncbi:hypothetical protein D9M71_646910 [compost metagenome]
MEVGVPKHFGGAGVANFILLEIVLAVAFESLSPRCLDDGDQAFAVQPFDASGSGRLLLGHADSCQATLFVKAGRSLIELFRHTHGGARACFGDVQQGKCLFDGGCRFLHPARPLLEKILDFNRDTPRPFGMGLGSQGKGVQFAE